MMTRQIAHCQMIVPAIQELELMLNDIHVIRNRLGNILIKTNLLLKGKKLYTRIFLVLH